MTRTSQAYTRNTKPQEAQPLPSRLVRLLYEARWIVYAVITAYLIIIFATYSKSDPGWSHGTLVPRMHNWGGRIGAWLSDLMLFVFGASAWWWCALLLRTLWQGYRRISQRFVVEKNAEPEHRHEGLIRGAGFVLILVGSLGLEYTRMQWLASHVQLPRAPGGVLGQLIGSGAQTALGFTGSTLFLLLLFALGISLFFHVSWLTVAERIGAGIENGLLWLKNFYVARVVEALQQQDRAGRRRQA